MKKTVLTFAAIAFGMGVTFAQTTPVTKEGEKKSTPVTTEQILIIDKVADQPAEEVAGRRELKVDELPAAVQKALKDGEFKTWKVVTAAELQGNAQNPAVTYEVALISEDMKDEIKDSQESTEELKEEVLEEGAEATEKMVEVKVPGVVLRYDQSGKLLSRVENTPKTEQDQE